MLPESGAVQDAIHERAAVGRGAAFDRPWHAHELGFEKVRRNPDGGVAVAAEIDERQMRRQVAIRKRSGLLDVARIRILEGSSNTVPPQHVDRWFGLRFPRPVGEIHAAQWHIFLQPVLCRLDRARRRNRTDDKFDANGFE